MKRCNHCRNSSPEGSRFCIICGRSFGAKLCPKLHPNSLAASRCATCGSPNLSDPHPVRPLSRLLKVAFIVGSIGLALLAIVFLHSVLDSTLEGQSSRFLLVLPLIGILLLLLRP